MTVDDLIGLLENLIAHEGASVRNPPAFAAVLDDEQYAVLIQFVAGERPVFELPPALMETVRLNGADPERLVRRDPVPDDFDDDPEELDRDALIEAGVPEQAFNLKAVRHAGEKRTPRPTTRDPDKPLTLRGEFNDVSLP